MAKLNGVNVVAESIVYGGAAYVKMTEQAQVGDIVRMNEDTWDVTDGAFYEVTKVDEDNDPYVNDDVGDEYSLEGDDFTVFRRVTAETAAIPTKLPDTYVIHDGKVYVKEARKAEVGETVIVTNDNGRQYRVSGPSFNVSVGEVVTVTSVDEDGDIWDIEREPNSNDIIYDREYVVLVPTDTVTISDAEYTLEKRTAAKGESALLIKRDDERRSTGSINVEIGEVITIQSVDGDGDVWDIDGKNMTDLIFGDEYIVLVPKQTIPATYADVAEAKRKDAVANVKVGDLIRVIDAGSSMFKAGDILRRYWDGGTIGCYEYPNGERISADCLADDRVEPVTPAEAEAARKQTEESAKWDAIGREVGEIREGDVVRVTRGYSGHSVGTVGIVHSEYDTSSYRVTANGITKISDVELVAPVESLFNAN